MIGTTEAKVHPHLPNSMTAVPVNHGHLHMQGGCTRPVCIQRKEVWGAGVRARGEGTVGLNTQAQGTAAREEERGQVYTRGGGAGPVLPLESAQCVNHGS